MRVANTDRGKAFSSLIKLLGAGIVAGVLVALIALPGIGSAGITARDAASNFQEMDSELNTSPPSEKTVLYDGDGKPFARFFDKYRESVRLDQIAPVMRQAIIDIEDSRFYEHGAMDMEGTMRALASNLSSTQTQGGSTLTQQYVKNLLVDSAKTQEEYQQVTAPTAGRKVRELRYALEIERTMSKDQILEGYLNIAYFGAGAYGVQAASKRYFSKPASDLTLSEAALLAGITQNPTAYAPTQNPNDARARRNVVLYRMADLKHITKAQADKAAAEPVELNPTEPVGGCQTSDAPYFCQYVKYDVLMALSDGKYWSMTPEEQQAVVRKLNRGGYTVRTTLDTGKQQAVDKALRSTVNPAGNKVGAEAMVEPGTGKVRAIGVSKHFGPGEGRTTINLAADTAHGGGSGVSAGSTFKIFTLATALDQGIPVNTSIKSPETMAINGYNACPYHGTYDGKEYNGELLGGGNWPSVSNAGDSQSGTFNLKTGTWGSVNTFYAQLEKRVGICNSVKMAEKFGMTLTNGEPILPVPSQVLGSNYIDVVHLSAAYAGFAARGKYCAPLAVTEIVDSSGKPVELPEQDCHQALDQDVADKVNSILHANFAKGTVKGRGIGRPAAAKTGTCEAHSCALFAGHTPNLAAVTAYWDFRGPWKYKVHGVYGADLPGAMWQQSMRSALQGAPAPGFSTPARDFGDTVKVPNVANQKVADATKAIEDAGFEVQIAAANSDKPRDTVVSSSPAADSEAPSGSTVILYVSRGPREN